MLVKSLAVSGLVAMGNAHMLMSNPVPYGQSSLTNGPLAADGSDFPCKQRGNVYAAEGASNVYKQGSSQQLTFKGSAVHGGGSCQLSVTTDAKPTKNSVWKVIKSIEGGCPAKGQGGNMAGGAGQDDPFKYDFEIPREMAAGNYTLAWTWFNRIGNREMYMNCAPMTVTGSGGSQGFLDTLPDMFVANVGNDCKTKDNDDLQFPNPGATTDRFGQGTLSPPQGSGCQASSGGKKSGGNKASPTSAASSDNASAIQTSAVQTSAAVPTASEAPQYANQPATNPEIPGGVFMSVATSEAPAATSAPAAPAQEPSQGAGPASPEPAAPTEPAPASNNAQASGGYAAGTPCSSEGSWNCIGGSTFQRCGSGTWSSALHLPEGIACSPGEGSDIAMNAIKRHVVKRASRRSLSPVA